MRATAGSADNVPSRLNVQTILGRVTILGIIATLAASPTIALAAASTVSISVLPAQTLVGTTTVVLTAASRTQRGQLKVGSNIPWALMARVSNGAIPIAWKDNEAAAWRPLGLLTVLIGGPRGVHAVDYTIRIDSPGHMNPESVVVVSFCVVPQHETDTPSCDSP